MKWFAWTQGAAEVVSIGQELGREVVSAVALGSIS